MTAPHDSWASVYDALYEAQFGDFYQELTTYTLDTVRDLVRPGDSIVDFGAGTGRLAIPLSEAGYQVTAVDASAAMLDRLREKDRHSLVTCRHSTIADFEARDPFDAAIGVFSVLIYLTTEAELDRSLEVIYRSLKPHGTFIVDVASSQLFTSRSTKAFGFLRTTDIEPQGNDIYRYRDRITATDHENKRQFYDEFLIRYWPADVILDRAASHGLRLEKQLDGFASTGASYFQLTRT
jgi:SAM-dependent methyltransferase